MADPAGAAPPHLCASRGPGQGQVARVCSPPGRGRAGPPACAPRPVAGIGRLVV